MLGSVKKADYVRENMNSRPILRRVAGTLVTAVRTQQYSSCQLLPSSATTKAVRATDNARRTFTFTAVLCNFESASNIVIYV